MTTGEGGFAILDDSSNIIARFGAGEGVTLTQEMEIMRGDLTKLLAGAADASDKVSYRYGCTVSEIRQSEGHVTAVISDSNGKAEHFAAIIGADGLRSKTRQMMFDKEAIANCYKTLDQYCIFSSLKGELEDVPDSRLQHAPGRRAILVRPAKVDSNERSSCYMLYTVKSAEMASALDLPMDKQKATIAKVFKDFPGRIGERALQGIWDAKDFYYSETAQIKLPNWSNGRCVLVGDAAYASSAASGQGTGLAILGAYLIAGELAMNPDIPGAAFAKYEERLRDRVRKAQTVPLGGALPKLGNPNTYAGIYVLRFLFWLVAWSGVWKWINIKESVEFDLPKYDFETADIGQFSSAWRTKWMIKRSGGSSDARSRFCIRGNRLTYVVIHTQCILIAMRCTQFPMRLDTFVDSALLRHDFNLIWFSMYCML